MKLDPAHIVAARPYPQWRFLQLTLAIVAWMLVQPILAQKLTGQLAMQVLLLDLMLVTMWANHRWRRVRQVVVVLWLLSLTMSVASMTGLTQGWAGVEETLDISCTIPVTAACAVGVLAFAFRSERPTLDGIFAMIVAYLLIAMLFAELYYLLLIWNPGALHLTVPLAQQSFHELRGDLMYFSLVTLSTVGYGDILPVSSTARVLANVEALAGQFYVAVVVATFVSMYTTQAMAARLEARKSNHPHAD
jgi:hypothetical protein